MYSSPRSLIWEYYSSVYPAWIQYWFKSSVNVHQAYNLGAYIRYSCMYTLHFRHMNLMCYAHDIQSFMQVKLVFVHVSIACIYRRKSWIYATYCACIYRWYSYFLFVSYVFKYCILQYSGGAYAWGFLFFKKESLPLIRAYLCESLIWWAGHMWWAYLRDGRMYTTLRNWSWPRSR